MIQKLHEFYPKIDSFIAPLLFVCSMFYILAPLSIWFSYGVATVIRAFIAGLFLLIGLVKIGNPIKWLMGLPIVAKAAIAMMVFWIIYGLVFLLFVQDRSRGITDIFFLGVGFSLIISYLMLCDSEKKFKQIFICIEVLLALLLVLSFASIFFAYQAPASRFFDPDILHLLHEGSWQQIFLPTGLVVNQNNHALIITVLSSVPLARLVNSGTSAKRKVVCGVMLVLVALVTAFINTVIIMFSFVFMIAAGVLLTRKYKYIILAAVFAICFAVLPTHIRTAHHNTIAMLTLSSENFDSVPIARARDLSGISPHIREEVLAHVAGQLAPPGFIGDGVVASDYPGYANGDGVVALEYHPPHSAATLEQKMTGTATSDRVDLLLLGLDMFLASRFLGVGPGAFSDNAGESLLRDPHSWPMEVLSQYGILISLAFAFVSFLIFKELIPIGIKSEVATAVLMMFLVYFPASFVGSAAIGDFFLWSIFSIFLAGAAFLPQIYKDKDAPVN
jgi:hypothetical protein